MGAFQVALVIKNLLVNSGDTRDPGSIPGQGTKIPQVKQHGQKNEMHIRYYGNKENTFPCVSTCHVCSGKIEWRVIAIPG